MRKKFVYFILVPFVSASLLIYFFIDRWIESGLEYTGQKIVGAKVEIDDLRLSLSPLGIGLARLQVANPQDTWKNVFETGKIQCALDFGQLLRGKFIVETMEVNGLILGTKRTVDGSLPGLKKVSQESSPATSPPAFVPPSGDTTSTLSQQVQPVIQAKQSKTPLFDLDKIKKSLNADSFLNVQNLKSYGYIDSLKKEINTASLNWQSTMTSLEVSKGRLEEVESGLKTINVGEIKSLDAAKSALSTVSGSYTTVTEISGTLKERQKALSSDFDRLSSSVKKIDDIAKEDFQNVLSMARLPDLSMKGISELILGKELLSKVTEYLYWVDFARANVPKYISSPEKDASKRYEGQTIHFPEERSYPKVWIKKILVSGGTDKNQDPNYFYAKGEVHDISTDQHVTGQPLTVSLEGTKGGATRLAFNSSFDRRTAESLDRYKVNVSGLSVADLSTGRSDFVPSKITNAVAGATINIDVPGSGFESNTNIEFGGVNLVFEAGPRNSVERLVRDVLESVKRFTVSLRVWKDAQKFDIALVTDLDDQIAARTKKVIGDELARIQADLRTKLNVQIAQKRQEVERLFNEKKDEINARLKSYEGVVNEKIAMVEGKKKEVENRIEEEKKKQTETVKKKAEETIKGLLKKN